MCNTVAISCTEPPYKSMRLKALYAHPQAKVHNIMTTDSDLNFAQTTIDVVRSH